MKKILLFMCSLMCCAMLQAQTGTITGVVANEATGAGLSGLNVTVIENGATTVTNVDGGYSFSNLPYNTYTIQISADGFEATTLSVKVDKATVDAGRTTLHVDDNKGAIDNIPTVTISESDLKETSSAAISSALSASRDVFIAAISFNFSALRFRFRGYDDENFITLMNGAPMTDLTNGRTVYFTWSGLNDVMRSREANLGLNAASYTYGNIGGSYFIDSRASKQRKQIQASYSLSNRSYDNRFMLTYGSGWMKGGWAVSGSVSRRWANEGFIRGTFSDGYSYFLAVDKKINNKHMLSLTTFAAPNKTGRSAPATQEQIDLAGDVFYNSAWGYQNGKVRNINVAKNFEPTTILTHEWKISDRTQLVTAASMLMGTTSRTAFDWYNAPDPRPEYYKNLPSYYETPAIAQELAAYLKANPDAMQIQWDELYEANRLNNVEFKNVDGIAGNNITGKRSLYIVEDRKVRNSVFNLNTYINTLVGQNITLNAGLTFQKQKSNYYKEVADLLGGDFYVDVNRFAEFDAVDVNAPSIQNDINRPNRILKVGDRFGYDYDAFVTKGTAWANSVIKFKKIDVFGGIELSNSSFYRNGNTRFGLFPDDSYGKAAKQSFTNYQAKAGVTYKINGRNYLFINGGLLTRAPFFENAYLSPRSRNQVAPSLQNEKVTTVEGGYLLRAPRLKARAVAYMTMFKNQVNTLSYFSEDFNQFVNLTTTGIEKTHKGLELAVEYNLGLGITVSAVSALGQYIYTNRPLLTVTQDNTAAPLAENQTVYINNFHIAAGPQSASTVGIAYRSKNFWFVTMNVNYFDEVYTDLFTYRRTVAATDLIVPESELWNTVLKQPGFEGQMTVDFFGGWSWRANNKFKSLKHPTFIVLSVGVSNILNNEDLITGGFEQARYRTTVGDFATFSQPRTFRGFGRTFLINLALRMN